MKNGSRSILFLSFFLSLTAIHPVFATLPTPVSHWTLNNTSNDSAGSNHGTLQGDATWTAGVDNGALYFDGSGDYMSISSTTPSPSYTPTPTPNLTPAPHGPETNCYPFYHTRNEQSGTQFFPNGWYVFVHDLWSADPTQVPSGQTADPADSQGNPIISGIHDWENGYVNYLRQEGCWWINYVNLEPFDNRVAWGLDPHRPQNQWTTTERYKRMLDGLEIIKNDTGGVYDIKAYPRLLKPLGPTAVPTPTLIGPLTPTPTPHIDFVLHTAGDWRDLISDPGTIDLQYPPSNGLASEVDIFNHRINYLKNEPQLGGWLLADEPYGGDTARQIGVRNPTQTPVSIYSPVDDIYTQLQTWKGRLEINDSTHPIYCVFRGNGNYNYFPQDHPEWTYLTEDLDVCDYVIDDLYLDDYARSSNGLYECVLRTQQAMAQLTNPQTQYGVQDNDINAWMLYSAGQKQVEEISSVYVPVDNPWDDPGTNPESGYLTDEQLRYVNYAPWINGAQGCSFLFLSKSDPIAFPRAVLIGWEASIYAKALMQPDAGIAATITSTHDHDSTAQFILREDPNFVPDGVIYRRKILYMVCNNSLNDTCVYLQFPANEQIEQVFSAAHSWSHSTPVNNQFFVGMAGRTARAFWIMVGY